MLFASVFQCSFNDRSIKNYFPLHLNSLRKSIHVRSSGTLDTGILKLEDTNSLLKCVFDYFVLWVRVITGTLILFPSLPL